MEKDIELNKTAEILHKHWAKWVIETFPGFQDVSKESFDENFSHQFVIDAMEEYLNAQQHSISDEDWKNKFEYNISGMCHSDLAAKHAAIKCLEVVKANTLHGNSGVVNDFLEFIESVANMHPDANPLPFIKKAVELKKNKFNLP